MLPSRDNLQFMFAHKEAARVVMYFRKHKLLMGRVCKLARRGINKMAEHKALLKRINVLSDLLQHDVVSISCQLLETGLVTKEVHDWVLTALGVSNKQKAARLVSCVADQIKASSEKYDMFIGVLKKEPSLQGAVEILPSKALSKSL